MMINFINTEGAQPVFRAAKGRQITIVKNLKPEGYRNTSKPRKI